jgi:hypothetical protein
MPSSSTQPSSGLPHATHQPDPWVMLEAFFASFCALSEPSVRFRLNELLLKGSVDTEKVVGPDRIVLNDLAISDATPLAPQPQTNPKYQFVNALYISLALFEATNHAPQLVESTLGTSLITQRSLVQIQPPQPHEFPGRLAPTLLAHLADSQAASTLPSQHSDPCHPPPVEASFGSPKHA